MQPLRSGQPGPETRQARNGERETTLKSPDDLAVHTALRQALARILQEARLGIDQLLQLDSDPTSVDALLADPNSPVNAPRTLEALRVEAAAQREALRVEAAAQREALRPFAQAYSKMAEPLDDLQIRVFIDVNRPEHCKSVYMSDFKRAHHAYASMSIGAETVERLTALQRDLGRAGELLGAWLADDGPFSQEDLDDSKRLAETYGRKKP